MAIICWLIFFKCTEVFLHVQFVSLWGHICLVSSNQKAWLGGICSQVTARAPNVLQLIGCRQHKTDPFTLGQQEKLGRQSQSPCVKYCIQFVMSWSGGDLFLHMRSLCQQDEEAVKCKTKFPVLGVLSLSSQARQHGVPRRGSSYTGRKKSLCSYIPFLFSNINRLQKNESKSAPLSRAASKYKLSPMLSASSSRHSAAVLQSRTSRNHPLYPGTPSQGSSSRGAESSALCSSRKAHAEMQQFILVARTYHTKAESQTAF